MRETLASLAILAKTKLASAMVYRLSFFAATLSDASLFITQLVLLRLLSRGATGSWDANMMTIFMGSFTTLDGLYMATWFFGVISLPGKIKSGELDLILTRPLHPLLYLSFCQVDIGSLPVVALGLVMTALGAHGAGCLALGNVLLWLLALGLMYVLMYALSLLLRSIAFWTTSTAVLDQIEGELVTYSFRLPLPAIQGAWKFILLMLLPYGLAANFPTLALAGQTTLPMWLYACCITAAFLALAVLVWNKGLRRYESASS